MVTHSNRTFMAYEGQFVLKYRAVIQEIGPLVPEFLPHGILIFFGETAPIELREVSLIHNGRELVSELVVGDRLRFVPSSDNQDTQPLWYHLTAVGEVASANLAELGHLVVHFDAAPTPHLPGTISVEPSLTVLPSVGTTIEIFGLEEK